MCLFRCLHHRRPHSLSRLCQRQKRCDLTSTPKTQPTCLFDLLTRPIFYFLSFSNLPHDCVTWAQSNLTMFNLDYLPQLHSAFQSPRYHQFYYHATISNNNVAGVGASHHHHHNQHQQHHRAGPGPRSATITGGAAALEFVSDHFGSSSSSSSSSSSAQTASESESVEPNIRDGSVASVSNHNDNVYCSILFCNQTVAVVN